MSSILAELYQGNYAPQDNHTYRGDSEYGLAFSRLIELENELLREMTEEEKICFEKFNEVSAELSAITGKLGFEDGFRLGVQLMFEALVRKPERGMRD